MTTGAITCLPVFSLLILFWWTDKAGAHVLHKQKNEVFSSVNGEKQQIKK